MIPLDRFQPRSGPATPVPALPAPPPSVTTISTDDRGDYVIYEPAVGPAPVVAFLHGAGNADPEKYQTLLQHLARSGFIVVFPRYHEDGDSFEDGLRALLTANEWESTALSNLQAALESLRSRGRIRRDGRGEQFAIAGHSMGGLLALRIANQAGRAAGGGAISAPRAIVLHDAAGYSFLPFLTAPVDLRAATRDRSPERSALRDYLQAGDFPAILDDLTGIAPDTLLVVLAADETVNESLLENSDGDDVFLGNSNAGGVWSRAWHETGVSPDRKHAFRVPGGHDGVMTEGFTWPYLRLTQAAVEVAFSGADFRVPGLAGVTSLPLGFDPPVDFDWNCDVLTRYILSQFGLPCPPES